VTKRIVLIILVLLTLIIGAGIFFAKPNLQTLGYKMANPGCQQNPNPVFTADITDLSKVKHIVPPVTVQQSGVKTHSYLFTDTRVPVYAPADAIFIEGAFYEEEGVGQYWLMFQTSCEVFFMFDHIKEPIDSIKANFPETPAKDSRTKRVSNPVKFKAGELIGYTTGTSHGVWDFGVYNTTKQNPFSDLEPDYKDSLRIANAVCPYEYFFSDKKKIYFGLFQNTDGSEFNNPHNLCLE